MRARELIAYLDARPDEVAVLSVIGDTVDGQWRLRCGSLMLGPPRIADAGWPVWWQSEHSSRPSGVKTPADELGQWLFDTDQGFAARVCMTLPEATSWLDDALLKRRTRTRYILPAMETGLAPPSALVRVGSEGETPASDLAWQLGRPLDGYMFPVDEGPTAALPEQCDTPRC